MEKKAVLADESGANWIKCPQCGSKESGYQIEKMHCGKCNIAVVKRDLKSKYSSSFSFIEPVKSRGGIKSSGSPGVYVAVEFSNHYMDCPVCGLRLTGYNVEKMECSGCANTVIKPDLKNKYPNAIETEAAPSTNKSGKTASSTKSDTATESASTSEAEFEPADVSIPTDPVSLEALTEQYLEEAVASNYFNDDYIYKDLMGELDAIRRVARDPVSLSFCGNFSVGKSMVINSILGEEIAPVNVKPTTAIICHFKYGDSKKVDFHYRDGKRSQGSFFDFKRFSDHTRIDSEEEEEFKKLSHVVVYYPNEILRELKIIDTPGFGSAAESDDETTADHLKKADAVCWVFDAEEAGKRDEKERISRFSEYFRTAFAIINKCDNKAPDDRLSLQKKVEKDFPEVFDTCFLYSAQTVLDKITGEDDDPDDEYLCTELPCEIQERVKDKADSLRISRAIASLQELARDNLTGITWQLEFNDVAIDFLDNKFIDICHREGENFYNKLKRNYGELRNRLLGMHKRNQHKLVKAFKRKDVLFGLSKEVKFEEDQIDEFRKALLSTLEESFSPWRKYVNELVPETFEAIKTEFRNFSNHLSEEKQQEEWDSVSERFDAMIDDFSDRVQADFNGIIAGQPYKSIEGALYGVVETIALFNICEVKQVPEFLYDISSEELANFMNAAFGIEFHLFDLDWDLGLTEEFPEDQLPFVVAHFDEIIEKSDRIMNYLIEESNKLFRFKSFLESILSFTENA